MQTMYMIQWVPLYEPINGRRLVFISLLLFCLPLLASSQNEEEELQKNVLSSRDYQEDWVPTLLSASSLPLNSLAQFNGYIFHWDLRGSIRRSGKQNGIQWGSLLSGWNASTTYAGLYKAFQSDNSEMGSSNAFNNSSGGSMSTQSNGIAKNTSAGMRWSNSSFVQEAWIHFQSGEMIRKKKTKSWDFQVLASWQQAPIGLLPIGFKTSKGVLMNVQKNMKHFQTMSATFWWAPSAQGKISPSVQEAIALSQQRNYNPSWGWYHGNTMYAATKSSNVPVGTIQYEKKWMSKAFLQVNLGGAFGTQSQTQLDWTKSMDPRPDYYKYLPSYSKDSLMSSLLNQYFVTHPQALQINFDPLEKINQSNLLHRSFYIINRRVSELSIIKASILGSYVFSCYSQIQVGLQLSMDKIRYYNVLDNLIGGDFFYNYNGWVDDNGMVDNFQNDIQHPNRKIKQGEKWGSDYALSHQQIQFWTIIKKEFPRHEISFRWQAAQNVFQRIGYVQNGLFPSSSLGSSSPLSFPEYQIQGHYLYKFSGKWYAELILQQQTNAPFSSSLYLDPALHNATASFILPPLENSSFFTIYYRSVSSKMNVSFYLRAIKNESEKNMFYHDQYGAFVYGMVGQKNSIFKGIEWSGEKTISSSFQMTWASTWNHYYISNNPLYEIKLTNDLFKVASGTLLLKNLPASTSPQSVHAITLVFQPSYSFRFGITGVYAMQRSIDYNLIRRSEDLLRNIQDPILLNSIVAPHWLPDQMVWNSFLTKNFQTYWGRKKTFVKLSLSTRNIFNTLIPILAFEQSRFDYIGKSLEKFPVKYLYDQGATYTLGFQITIQ